MILRPYQREAVERCYNALGDHDRVLLVMATGLGKTVIFSELAVRYSSYGRVLILTHREELVWQALRHLDHAAPGVEMRSYRHGTGYYKKRIVVGTVQTVHRRLGMFTPETFSLVVFDEAHHCAAPTWKKIMHTFRGSKMLGVTATPRRSDAQPIPGFQEVAYSFPLADAVRQSWLVPIRSTRMTDVRVDLSGATVRSGDYTAESLDAILSDEKKLHPIADVAICHAESKVLVFMPSSESSNRLHEIIERYAPGTSVVIDYKQDSDYRKACVEMFRAGDRKILVNCMIATEGFDVPDVGTVVIARPTKSVSLYEQMVGRGTRPLTGLLAHDDDAATRAAKIAASAKPHLMVINVHAVNGQYADTANIIDPNLPLMDDELATELEQKISDDTMDAIQRARIAEQVFKAKIEEKRRSIVATYIQYQLSKDGAMKLLGMNPDDADSELAETDSNIVQEAKLLGVPLTNMTTAMWRQVRDELANRQKENLATYKQLKMLRNRGIPDDVLRLLKIGEASVLIDALKSGRFIFFAGIRVPKSVQELKEMRRRDFFRERLGYMLGKKGA